MFSIKKPFVVAGDHHSDIGVKQISIEELLSGDWDEHIIYSICEDFVKRLRDAIKMKEPFPQKFILEMMKRHNKTEE